MLLVPNYKTADEFIAEVDTGGKWHHLYSQKNDGQLTHTELDLATGSFPNELYLHHIISCLPKEEVEKIGKAVPPEYFSAATRTDSSLPSPSAKESWRESRLSLVSIVGTLKPHRELQVEEMRVAAWGLSASETMSHYPKVDDFNMTFTFEQPPPNDAVSHLKDVYHLGIFYPDVAENVSASDPLLVFLPKKKLRRSNAPALASVPHQRMRLTGLWDGIFDEVEKTIDWWHIRALFYTPLGAEMRPPADEDHTVAGDLLRNAMTHRVK